MRALLAILTPVCVLALIAGAQDSTNPFAGRWDFNVNTHGGVGANWLGITDHNGELQIWFQPTGGNVYQVTDFHMNGSELTMTVAPATATHAATIWQLKREDGKLTGFQIQGDNKMPLEGFRAPELNHAPPTRWSQPESLFNGKNLDGWEPIGNPAYNHWVAQDGMLVNTERGDNLRTVREFEDFKVHFEVNCPEDGNSGFYLRGRYEVQIEYEPEHSQPLNRAMGSIYGRIAPSVELPRKPGQWESFDVTLVGRTVTEVRDGVTVIDHKQIDGITGGALNANEGMPGPFYIQGDHTGGIKFRNITVSVPQS